MLHRLKPQDSILKTLFRCPKGFVSTTWPNPKKLTVVSQYAKDSFDFSFLSSEYSVEFVELDRIQSKQEFIDAVKRIEKDRVVINLIDNCEEVGEAVVEKYLTNDDAKVLEGIEKADSQTENEAKADSKKPDQNTYYKVCGLTAIEWYNRLELAFTGASARNFATQKTDLKVKGISTPQHIVVLNRQLAKFSDSDGKSKKPKQGTTFPLKFPVLVKPLKDYGGSTFIQEKMKCTNMKELRERVENFPVPEMVVEEFITGEEHEILIFQAATEQPGISKLIKTVRRLREKQDIMLRKMTQSAKIKKLMPSKSKGDIYHELRNRIKRLAHPEGTASGTIEKPYETRCTVTHPNQVVLPSPESFQHEELKWRALNDACAKVTSGKSNEEQFMLKYRPVPQNVFPRSSKRETNAKTFTKEIMGKLSSPQELRKIQQDKMVRDAYLNRAIKEVARHTWQVLKHDGYFRYDFRVVEDETTPPAPPGKIAKMLDECDSNVTALPKSKLLKFLPRYNFRVYVVDANPYCSVFGIPRTYGDSDKLLAYTPYLTHKVFLDKIVRAGVCRELRRRKERIIRESSRSVIHALRNSLLSQDTTNE
ncbi:D-alanine--D-alanine ligase [Perkinsela sp. CCAP 1560/4]|nr:D-alanine--D-alanine ligase [Perkinsela sp. CCAP 1560/4]|eukprot:KNH05406.1 D-alanine--D-alanine ligase [Perkinsela sp. CCAP 1560/4]